MERSVSNVPQPPGGRESRTSPPSLTPTPQAPKFVVDDNIIWSPLVNTSGSDGCGAGEGSAVKPSEEQKRPVTSTKKEPPTYPPGETG